MEETLRNDGVERSSDGAMDVMTIYDILDKMQFFQGQRAGRELWNDKPIEVQQQDLDSFNKGIRDIRDYMWDLEKELEEYKKLEEQGLLLKLPCKVGDTVWSIEMCDENGRIEEFTVTSFSFSDGRIYAKQGYVFIGEVGFSVFASQEEAEKKLADMVVE